MKLIIIEDDFEHYECIEKMLRDPKNGLVLKNESIDIWPKNKKEFDELRNNVNMITSCDEIVSEEAKKYLKENFAGADYAVIDYMLNQDNKLLHGLWLYSVLSLDIKSLIYTSLVATQWEKLQDKIKSDGLSDKIISLQKPNRLSDVCLYEHNIELFIGTIIRHYNIQEKECMGLHSRINGTTEGVESNENFFPLPQTVDYHTPIIEERKINIDKQSVKVFYSYSHIDEKYRNQLEKHLKILERSGIINQWHDRKIDPGYYWESAIDNNLEQANIILFLVSSNFIASDYCWDKEVTRALERHKSGDAIVIPVIISDVMWDIAPFAALQALPKDGKPVDLWPNKNSAWRDVTEGIKIICNKYFKGNLR